MICAICGKEEARSIQKNGNVLLPVGPNCWLPARIAGLRPLPMRKEKV